MNKRPSNKAFSLLELSLVILIIGVLISAFIGAADLASDAKLRQAKTLTQNSPVVGISKLALWLDATSDQSFLTSEVVDGAVVTRWNNLNPESLGASYLVNTAAPTTDNPTYKESCINGLPCLYFDGGDKITAARSLGIRSKYISAFFVFTGPENATPSYSSQLFSSITTNISWTAATGIFIFTTSNTTNKCFIYGVPEGYGVKYTDCRSGGTLASKVNYVYSLVDDYSSSIYQYINGAAINNAGATGAVSKSLEVVGFGNSSFQGNIGEAIIFTKALTTDERKSVEQYLGKKWGIKVSS